MKVRYTIHEKSKMIGAVAEVDDRLGNRLIATGVALEVDPSTPIEGETEPPATASTAEEPGAVPTSESVEEAAPEQDTVVAKPAGRTRK